MCGDNSADVAGGEGVGPQGGPTGPESGRGGNPGGGGGSFDPASEYSGAGPMPGGLKSIADARREYGEWDMGRLAGLATSMPERTTINPGAAFGLGLSALTMNIPGVVANTRSLTKTEPATGEWGQTLTDIERGLREAPESTAGEGGGDAERRLGGPASIAAIKRSTGQAGDPYTQAWLQWFRDLLARSRARRG